MPARPNSTDNVIGNLRRSIATQAARLIAEEGIDDYAFAKRKAARQLGVPERDLPSNACPAPRNLRPGGRSWPPGAVCIVTRMTMSA